jgi:hypothetical protein
LWIETPKNSVARDVYARYGFEVEEKRASSVSWILDLNRCRVENTFIQVNVNEH